MQRYAVCAGISAALIFALTTASIPSSAAETTLRLGIQPELPSLPVIVAAERGFLVARAQEAGLGQVKVTLQLLSGAAAVNEALIARSIDASVLGATALLGTWDRTRGRENVRALLPLTTLDVTLFTNRAEIRSLADFREPDRIAVPATASPQAIILRMAAEKLAPEKRAEVERLLIVMPHPEAMAALLAGKVAGYVASQPGAGLLARNDKVHALITSKDVLGGEEVTGAVVAAAGTFVDGNPAAARAIGAALEDAIGFIRGNPDEAADIYVRSQASNVARADILAQLTDGSMVYSTAPSGFARFARFMAKAGLIANEPASWKDVFFPLLHDRSGS
jgi:ABC-type nitrate/sulfonate/bicarbonate transport system substrate-binding protein